MRRTIEQDRARAAWAAVGSVPETTLSKYHPLAQGAPVAVHTAGLGQAVAFWLSRKRPETDALLGHLAAWLLRPGQADRPDPSKRGGDLMEAVQNGSGDDYRRLTAEALAYLAWLKRFAAAKADDRPDSVPAQAA